MDYTNRHLWKYPRTARDVFGSELDPLRKDLTFLPDTSKLLIIDLFVVFLLLAYIWTTYD